MAHEAKASLQPSAADRVGIGRWVRDLRATSAVDIDEVGGKAAGLMWLVDAGLPVPEGFVVLAGAYRRFVEANGLQPEIDVALDAEAADDPGSRSSAVGGGRAAALAQRFVAEAMPDEVAVEIRDAYATLGRPTMAVRSSSVNEDLAGASFAGQYASFLNVGDEDALLVAVARCWESAWGPRVAAYRAAQGVVGDVDHAVVVQRQVDADRAGVAFGADPVSGRRDRVRINGAWGLGQAVVDGAVTPDEWLVDPDDGEVVERSIADKAVWTVPADEGISTVDAPTEQRERPSLTDEEVVELARLARRAEAVFGAPQDLEWVVEDGRLLLVQSRPLTTLFPLPEPLPEPGEGVRLYLSLNRVAQGFVEPMTPMGNEIWRLFFAALGRLARGERRSPLYPKIHRVAAGRVYLDFTGLLRRPRVRKPLLEFVGEKDPPAARALAELVEREQLSRGRREGPFPWRLATFMPGLLARLALAAVLPQLAATRGSALADSEVVRLEREAAGLSGVAQRLEWLERETMVPMLVFVRQAGWYGLAAPTAQVAEQGLAEHVDTGDAVAAVHHAPPHNPTAEMGRDLLEAAARMRDTGGEASTDHVAVAWFLDRYGHRTVREIDVGLPRWREDPSPVLGWIGETAADPTLDRRLADARDAVAAADHRAAKILARVPGRLRRARIGWHLRRARTLIGMRERPKFDEARCIEVYRRVLLDVGEELHAAGHLDDADDVMFVTLADIRGDGDLRDVAEANRRAHEAEMQRTSIPRVMTSTGEAIYAVTRTDDDTDLLTGVAASPGVVEGTVRIVTEPDAGALEPGEILVTHSTDPLWTPIMLRAGGLVMETGGPLMHGAIVAREQGIPAVAGLEGITNRLVDGDRVRVDGGAGSVTVL